ncbi:hypothetical protein ACPCK8_04210 [Streptomyces cellulosae]
MRRSFGIASLAATVSLAAVIVAPPASAGTSDRNACLSTNSVCIFRSTNWSGNMFSANSNWSGQCRDSLVVGNSVVNGRTAQTIRFFSKDGCNGSYFDIKKRDYSADTPFAVHSFRVL